MDIFTFDCDLNDVDLSRQDIINMLPRWKTKIQEVKKIGENNSLVQIKFLVSAITIDQIKLWIKDYEKQTYCTYRIRNTILAKGRTISFKQVLNCQHNCNYTSPDPSKRKTKNTNCPSTMTIKLFTIKKNYQRKDPKKIPAVDMPCEVLMIPTHNHRTDSVDVLRFRPVSNEVKRKLLELYNIGYSPASALEAIKTDLMLKSENYLSLLIDRRYCPDYSYCLNLFTRFKRSNSSENHKFKHKRKPYDEVKIMKQNEEMCPHTKRENSPINIGSNEYINLNFGENMQEEIEVDENIKNCKKLIENNEQIVTSIVESTEVPVIDQNNDIITVYNRNRGEYLLKQISANLKDFIQEHPNEAIDCLENFNKRVTKIGNKLKLKQAIAKFGSELKFSSISSRKCKQVKSKQRSDFTIELTGDSDLLKNIHNYAINIEK